MGGYHGVKLRRYQDLYDSCLYRETNALIRNLQAGNMDLSQYGVINMLNIKYMVFGPQRDNIIPNPAANGNAWFVRNLITASSANDELKKVCTMDTKTTALVNDAEFKVENFAYDSAASIRLTEHNPNYLKYESESQAKGFAVFSEIYYPKGWIATIDGKESEIIRADFVLRALSVPPGNHTIEFNFKPNAYVIGNKVTTASSWIMILVVLGSLGWAFKSRNEN